MLASTFDFNAIVDACTRQIIAACRGASVLLAAYSFGGCVAFETAQRLIRSNYRVDFLGLIDAPFEFFLTRSDATSYGSTILQMMYRPYDPNGLSGTFYLYFANLFVRWCIDGLVCRWPAPIVRVFCSSIIPLLPPGLAHSFKRHLCGALRIKYVSQWSPIALGVPITLFRSDDPQLGSERTYGWDEVCTSLTVVSIGGNHSTIFEQPQLDLLSSCFLKAINTLQRSGASNRETNSAS